MPLANSEIVQLYLDGTPLIDLTLQLRCSVERLKGILRAYDVQIRSRSEAIQAANRSKVDRTERRLERMRALGPPTD